MLRTLLLSIPLFAESFDIYTYDAPNGYKHTQHKDVAEYAKINQQRRYFCQFALQRAQRSTASAEQDAQREWQAVVAHNFKVRGQVVTKPMPLPGAPDSVVLGAEATGATGINSIVSLFVIRQQDRFVGILFSVSNAEALEACQTDATNLVTSVRVSPGTTPAPTPMPTGGGGITGVWERLSVSKLPGQFNPSTRQWDYNRTSDKYSFRNIRRFKFEANGDYTFEFEGEETYYQQRNVTIERGTYSVKGDVLSLSPRDCHSGKSPKSQTPQLKPCATPAASSVRIAVGAELQMLESDGTWAAYKPVR